MRRVVEVVQDKNNCGGFGHQGSEGLGFAAKVELLDIAYEGEEFTIMKQIKCWLPQVRMKLEVMSKCNEWRLWIMKTVDCYM